MALRSRRSARSRQAQLRGLGRRSPSAARGARFLDLAQRHARSEAGPRRHRHAAAPRSRHVGHLARSALRQRRQLVRLRSRSLHRSGRAHRRVCTPENGRSDATVDVYRTYARLHTRLFPYEWTYALRIAVDGRPIPRPLGLAYPEMGIHPSDVYLFGDDLLVAPVLTRGERTRRSTSSRCSFATARSSRCCDRPSTRWRRPTIWRSSRTLAIQGCSGCASRRDARDASSCGTTRASSADRTARCASRAATSSRAAWCWRRATPEPDDVVRDDDGGTKTALARHSSLADLAAMGDATEGWAWQAGQPGTRSSGTLWIKLRGGASARVVVR